MPRRGTLLRSGQYGNCAKRHSVSSSEAKPWALCLTRMRVNTQEEKRKYGIAYDTSSPLEKGRAEGAGWMCLEEAPFYVAVSMPTLQSATSYRHFERSEKSLSFAVKRIMAETLKRETCFPRNLRASPHIYCSEAATTTLNPEP